MTLNIQKPTLLIDRNHRSSFSQNSTPPTAPLDDPIILGSPRSTSPDIEISGGSLGTSAFTLEDLTLEMNKYYADIWGTDPTNNDELSDLDNEEGHPVGGDMASVPTHKGRQKHRAPNDNRYAKEMAAKIKVKVKHANNTKVIFNTFNFADAVGENARRRRENASKTEPKRTTWNDRMAHSGWSADGFPLIYSIPKAISKPIHDCMFSALMDMGYSVHLELGGGADGQGRNAKDSYVYREGELTGILKLVLLWHAIGHPNTPPTISRDFLKTGSQFMATTKGISKLFLLSRAVNALLQAIDPAQYEALETLRKHGMDEHPILAAISSMDPLVMEGRAIMFNRQTPIHPDRQDPFKSWATMITLGSFNEGGELTIPRLNLDMQYLPGDTVIVRGRILEHEVKAWGPGQRISVAHFTHETLWQSYGMECP